MYWITMNWYDDKGYIKTINYMGPFITYKNAVKGLEGIWLIQTTKNTWYSLGWR